MTASTLRIISRLPREAIIISVSVLATVPIVVFLTSGFGLAVPLAIGCAIILTVFAFDRPGFLFAAYIYIPFYKGSIQPYLPLDITPLLAVACLVVTVRLLPRIEHDRTVRSTIVVWTLVLALIAVGSFYSPDASQAFADTLYFLSLVYLPSLLGIPIARSEKLQRQLLVATIVLSASAIVLGIAQLTISVNGSRLTVLGANTIGAGRAALFIPLLAPSLFRSVPAPVKPLILSTSFAGILVSLATGSRGPLVMAILSLLIVQLLHNSQHLKKLGTLVAVVGASVVALQAAALRQLIPVGSLRRLENSWLYFSGANDISAKEAGLAGRIELFSLSQEMFLSMPLLGHGTSAFQWFVQFNPMIEDQPYPHNYFLQFAAEYGILGLSVAVLIVGLVIARGGSTLPYRFGTPIFTLTLFALLSAMVSNGIIDNRWLWGMVIIQLAMRCGAPAAQLSGDQQKNV